ncbi:MAG: hydrogenase nickel incorporation protein HypB [Deltaproteobacteria bacterium]|nr:hydrogenase nickel incorporation protein HypB [Deltaproteobacteria bacterium]
MHDVILNEKVLAKNIAFAENNKDQLKERGIFTINLISSPGSGKTSIVEKTVEGLQDQMKIAVIEGDIQADLDLQRLMKFNIPLRQINTGRSCHLDAHMVQHTLPWLFEQGDIDFLIIENVGNMVCPAEYDLGEDMKVALMSVTEGDDKPLKYPSMFHSSQYLLINKTDLLGYTDFNMEKAKANALKINPHLNIIETSCTSGAGIDAWLDAMRNEKNGKKSRALCV